LQDDASPLHWVPMDAPVVVALLLLEHGADVNLLNKVRLLR
jgi:hypothetical protein